MYTIIDHRSRKELGMSNDEYQICYIIFFRQGNPSGDGWCHESRSDFVEYLDLSDRSVTRLISRLVVEGFLIKNELNNSLKVTDKWYINLKKIDEENLSTRGQKRPIDWTKTPGGVDKNARPLYKKEYIISNKDISDIDQLVLPFNGDEFKAAWSNWISDRKQRGKKITQRAGQMQLKKISELTIHESEAILIIFQSIERGWQTFFPLAKNNGKSKQTNFDFKESANAMAGRHQEYATKFGK